VADKVVAFFNQAYLLGILEANLEDAAEEPVSDPYF
jgi:hypothetical protein